MYSDVVSANAAAIEVDRLQLMLNTKLKSTNAFSDLKLGHEEAIRIIDAVSFECMCCPEPSSSKRKLGRAFTDVLRHISMEQHRRCVDIWIKAKNKERLLRRLRIYAWVAGRAMQWHARAIERAYAPGGPGSWARDAIGTQVGRVGRVGWPSRAVGGDHRDERELIGEGIQRWGRLYSSPRIQPYTACYTSFSLYRALYMRLASSH